MTNTANNTEAAATTFMPEVKMHHATRAKAGKLAAMLAAEYPALSLDVSTSSDDEGNETLEFFVVLHNEDFHVYDSPKVPNLADILDHCADAGVDPTDTGEEDEDEEFARGGSVVPEKYRTAYILASSNGQTCGDWLAETLTALTHGAKGFVVAEFAAILDANAVDQTKKWASLPTSGQAGWVGRWRMNGRQALEKVVALTGVLHTQNGPIQAPEEALEVLRAKHAKWLAKQAKA